MRALDPTPRDRRGGLGKDEHARPSRRASDRQRSRPGPILLMTFSRRAATEMTRRVARIARQVIGDRAGVMTEALAWGVPLLDEDYLILSTIHSAKGQEWKSVFVLNAVDGCIPSDLATGTTAEIEEERRLLYVAMTRAKDDLHLIVPQRFFTHGQSAQGDRHIYAARTRFIPDGLLNLFNKTAWPVIAAGSAGVRHPSQDMRIDVGARMRGMWR